MSNLLHRLVSATHHFSAIDYAIFKICLLTIGILFGAYFSPFFQTYILVIWLIAIVTWFILMIQLIRNLQK